MSAELTNLARAKADARELQVMLRRSGVVAGLMDCQQAIAQMMGYPSWHVLRKQTQSGHPSENAISDAPFAETRDLGKQARVLSYHFGVSAWLAENLAGYLGIRSHSARVIKTGPAVDKDVRMQDLGLPSLESFMGKPVNPLELEKLLPETCGIDAAGAVLECRDVLPDEEIALIPNLLLTREPELWRTYSRALNTAWGHDTGPRTEKLSFLDEFDPFLVVEPITGEIIGGVAVIRYADGARSPGHSGSWFENDQVRDDTDGEVHARLIHEHCACHLMPGYQDYAKGLGMLFGALMAHEMAYLACSRRPRIYRVSPEIGETFTASNNTVGNDFLDGMIEVVDVMKDTALINERFVWCHFDRLVPDGYEDEWPLDEDEDP